MTAKKKDDAENTAITDEEQEELDRIAAEAEREEESTATPDESAIAKKIIDGLNELCIVAKLTDFQQTDKKTVLTFDDTDPDKFLPFMRNRGRYVAMTVRAAHGTEAFKESGDDDGHEQLGLPLTSDGPMPPKPDSLKDLDTKTTECIQGAT